LHPLGRISKSADGRRASLVDVVVDLADQRAAALTCACHCALADHCSLPHALLHGGAWVNARLPAKLPGYLHDLPQTRVPSLHRSGDGTVDRDTVASVCSTRNCLSKFNNTRHTYQFEVISLISMRLSNRIIPPSECGHAPLFQRSAARRCSCVPFWGVLGRMINRASPYVRIRLTEVLHVAMSWLEVGSLVRLLGR